MIDTPPTGAKRPLRFGVVAPVGADVPAWRDRVRRIADNGYSTLLMPDVPEWQPAPAPALAVAATVANLRVGTWVYAAPVRPAAADEILRRRDEIGFSYFVFGADFADTLAPAVAQLTGQ